MRIDMIPTGDNPPESLNVIIEVPVGGEPVKYEFDKASGALFVDRILHTPMRYPANYGFVPHTLSPDGDPLDALVIARSPFVPGSVVRARPIAVLNLEDEHGGDEKLVCVPVDSTFPYYSDVKEKEDIPEIVLQQIEHFFTHYKDLKRTSGFASAPGAVLTTPSRLRSKPSSAPRPPSRPDRFALSWKGALVRKDRRPFCVWKCAHPAATKFACGSPSLAALPPAGGHESLA